MSQNSFDPRRFRSTVPFYARYRLGYPDALIARVAAFLDGQAAYPAIAAVCAETLASIGAQPVRALDDALAADAEARAFARAWLQLPAAAHAQRAAAA